MVWHREADAYLQTIARGGSGEECGLDAAAAREKSVSQEAACKIIARRTTKGLEDAGDPLAPESTTARQRGGQSGR